MDRDPTALVRQAQALAEETANLRVEVAKIAHRSQELLRLAQSIPMPSLPSESSSGTGEIVTIEDIHARDK